MRKCSNCASTYRSNRCEVSVFGNFIRQLRNQWHIFSSENNAVNCESRVKMLLERSNRTVDNNENFQ
jgi:hypothetical protein